MPAGRYLVAVVLLGGIHVHDGRYSIYIGRYDTRVIIKMVLAGGGGGGGEEGTAISPRI